MNDLRFALRQLLKNPGFTAVAVLTLALGIGANTAIFSVVYGVLLRSLPFPQSDRLVWLSERGADWSGGAVAYPNFRDWKQQQSVFETFGVYRWTSFSLTGRGEPLQLSAIQMSADVFSALKVEPELGRTFSAEEDKPGGPAVAVLSHALWQSRFGGDPGIVNQPIALDGHIYTVVGVMPSRFEFPNNESVWVPIGPILADPNMLNRGNHPGLFGLARLKPGVTIERARADLETIALRLEQQYPEFNKTRRVRMDTLIENKVGDVGRALWILLGAVTLVLLIACANVANLLLARAAVREKEMALRAALGANRGRIVRQLLTESVLLGVLGAGAGLLFAQGALSLILRFAHDSFPRATEVSLDTRMLLFSGAVGILTGVIFGFAPAWHASRAEFQDTLKDGTRGSTSGRARLRQGLVVAEVALTLMLLVGAGLLLRSFGRLLQVKPGYNIERILTLHLNLPERKYPRDDQQIQFYQGLLEKVRAVPGVQAASTISQIPLEDANWDTHFVIEGQPEPPPHLRPGMQIHLAAPDYFRTMGISLLQGRDFNSHDSRDHLRGTGREEDWGAGLNAIIIDEESAKRFWPEGNAVGQRVRGGGLEEWMTVVGVVARVKEVRLNSVGGKVQGYLPFLQRPGRNMAVVIKTTVEPLSVLNAVRQQVAGLDSELPVSGIQTMREMRDNSIAPERLNLGLLSTFAGLALLLAVIGLYGVLAFIVAQRQREIGVRMALGAQRYQVLHLVASQGFRLVGAGVVLGLLGSVALTRVLTAALFGIEPTDPLTFSVVTLVLCGTAAFACYIPARRAAKVDPMVALRTE